MLYDRVHVFSLELAALRYDVDGRTGEPWVLAVTLTKAILWSERFLIAFLSEIQVYKGFHPLETAV